MKTKPTDDEIDDVLNRCAQAQDEGESICPGASYEQGVAAAIEWLRLDGDNPLN